MGMGAEEMEEVARLPASATMYNQKVVYYEPHSRTLPYAGVWEESGSRDRWIAHAASERWGGLDMPVLTRTPPASFYMHP